MPVTMGCIGWLFGALISAEGTCDIIFYHSKVLPGMEFRFYGIMIGLILLGMALGLSGLQFAKRSMEKNGTWPPKTEKSE